MCLLKKSVLKRDVSCLSSELEPLVKVCKLKLSARRYVSLSESCLLYSVVNHKMGTSAHPMFLSVIVNIMSLLFCSCWMYVDCSGVMFVWSVRDSEFKLECCNTCFVYVVVL